MLRKAGHIIILMMFLVSTMGVVINKHFAGGELYDIALFVDAESCCEVPGPCCEDTMEFHLLELDFTVDHQASPQVDFGIDIFDLNIIRSELHTDSEKHHNLSYLSFKIPKSPPNNLARLQTFLL